MAKERYVTFVVHGIGSPKSSSVQVDDATKKFATTWGDRNDTELKRTLYTAHPEHGDSVEYSVYEGQLENGKTQEFVEAQWADLSKAPSGYFSPVTSFSFSCWTCAIFPKCARNCLKIGKQIRI